MICYQGMSSQLNIHVHFDLFRGCRLDGPAYTVLKLENLFDLDTVTDYQDVSYHVLCCSTFDAFLGIEPQILGF